MPFLRSIAWIITKQLIRRQFPEVSYLSPKELTNWLSQRSDPPLLLDVRTAEEYAVSHLPTAQLAPRDPQLLSQWERLSFETPIVLYCSVGYRSARLAQQLQDAGYKTVFNLEGSIFQWANEGYPVQQNDRIVEQVHPYNALWGKLLDDEYR
jgi:rhodanese-related sulfurtransferase